ncbi:hotdog fold thioesterase [Knoellia subterranea]|uniref:Thioesterase n=1 Tax=Knoellia subterranea KCTC 19937 TaxID=1385521 RepID=A0A0A0JPX9_9MICO|nr:thioesterase [Knoellia subterranea KCTC 19937]
MSQSPIDPTTDLLPMVKQLNELNPNSLLHRMHIEVTEATRDRIVATMPVEGNTQPYGLLHGGASVVLAETLGSIGAAIHAGPDRIVVGTDINATHHRAARSGLVTGVATPISTGNTLSAWEIVVSAEDGKRVCTSRITCLVREAPPGS